MIKKFLLVRNFLKAKGLPKRLIEWMYKEYIYPTDRYVFKNREFLKKINYNYESDLFYDKNPFGINRRWGYKYIDRRVYKCI